jgi:hypothetical protein
LNAGNRWTEELDAAVRRLGELAAQAAPAQSTMLRTQSAKLSLSNS